MTNIKRLSRLVKLQIVLTIVGLIGVTSVGIISIQQTSAQDSSQDAEMETIGFS
jgi:hypothetical protein